MKATVVIGAGFGDEGKGHIVSHLATPQTMVVRYCSGGNAGHTVNYNGRRHVFHHFGSGSLKGAATYLSQFFIHNPILYFQELQQLNDLGVYPDVSVDGTGLVTVPADMMINQMVEMQRGQTRHGSCGVGINETIKRSEAGYSLLVDDLTRTDLRDQLQAIRSEWVPTRLAQLGLAPSTEWQERLDSPAILDAYLEHCTAYRRHVTIRELFDHPGDLLFEGAQGLLLDEEHEWFPYVTHAHTGLHNVLALVGNLDLQVIYVTRAYATRHGPGPFPREVAGLRYADATNVPNDWQGTLRFGHLDLDLLVKSARHDLRHAGRVRLGVAVTCLDQVVPDTTVWYQGYRWQVTPDRLVGLVRQALAVDVCLTSAGPQAAAIQVVAAKEFAL